MVTIAHGVKSIGEGAFFFCTSLKKAPIPSSVTSIGGKAFAYCSSLKDLKIPDGAKFLSEGSEDLGEKAFLYTKDLTNVTAIKPK